MKPCSKCGNPITWPEPYVKGCKPLNPDGTQHQCQKPQMANALIGRMTGYNSGSATFVMKDGKAKTYAIAGSVNQDFERRGYLLPKENHPDVWLQFMVDDKSYIQPGYQQVQRPEWADTLSDPTGGAIKTPFVKASELPKETPCTSPAAAPLVPNDGKMPDRDLLITMVYNPDTYWRAKCLMDIQAAENIRKQVEWKNWSECVDLAFKHHSIDDSTMDDIFTTAEQIHGFIKGKVGGGE